MTHLANGLAGLAIFMLVYMHTTVRAVLVGDFLAISDTRPTFTRRKLMLKRAKAPASKSTGMTGPYALGGMLRWLRHRSIMASLRCR